MHSIAGWAPQHLVTPSMLATSHQSTVSFGDVCQVCIQRLHAIIMGTLVEEPVLEMEPEDQRSHEHEEEEPRVHGPEPQQERQLEQAPDRPGDVRPTKRARTDETEDVEEPDEFLRYIQESHPKECLRWGAMALIDGKGDEFLNNALAFMVSHSAFGQQVRDMMHGYLTHSEEPAEPKHTATPSECCLCLDAPSTYTFVPCGHMCVCQGCYAHAVTMLSTCPFCRKGKTLMRVYM